MYSIGILSAVLFALVATTNAFQCTPVTCMITCQYGFEVDTHGCPICKCRQSPNVCVSPIFGYNCGSINHRDCPSSHECHFDFSGLSGQCCLKRADSTTNSPRTTMRLAAAVTSTAIPTTSGSRTSMRRVFNRMITQTTGAASGSTTNSPRTTMRLAAAGTSTALPTTSGSRTSMRRVFNRIITQTTGAASGSTTARSVTGRSSAAPSTQRWFF